VDTTALSLTEDGFADVATAQDALAEVQAAIDTLGDVQNTIGTLENRLGFAIGLATSQVVNKKAAESRIRDANIAEESANMTRFNILSQSGIAALAQANQTSSSVLSLLR
jgi:flagellin